MHRGRGRRALGRVAAVVGIATVAVAASGASASAGNSWLEPEQFAIETFTTASSSMQVGGHPDVSTSFAFRRELLPNVIPIFPDEPYPYGRVRRIEIEMPVGLVGDPTAFETCSVDRFLSEDPCPARTQVGVTDILAAGFFGQRFEDSGIYNLAHGPDEPVLLGIKPNPALYAFIRVKVKPDGGLLAIVDEVPIGHPLVTSDVTLWGVPADSNPANVSRDWPRVPFMSAPTECDRQPTTTLRAYTYEGKSASASHTIEDPPEGCDRVPFEPTMTAQPTSQAAAAPTGLDVSITVPQNNLPGGVTTAHVRSVQIVLPQGMSVSPSSANGLASCSPAQFGYRTDSAVSCPDASKVGSVAIKSPLLTEPLQGSVFLASQNDNPFGSLLALYIVAEGSGVQIKLAGKVDPDPVTGRLTTSFDDNPQLPFERFDFVFKSGSRAPLTNPQTCGTYTSQTRITAWTGRVVTASTPMTIDQDCVPVGFAPNFEAGTLNPVGGSASTFSLTFGRGDHDQELRDLVVDLPTGLTGKLAMADLCADAIATAGACGERSRIGSVTTKAGPGSTPFQLPGRAYLTGPYKGAPLGMAFVVPAVAGPLDLGTVVVRAAVFVDPRDASLRVVSDPLPRILQGIPLQIRSVNVAVDKPGFMINPSSCSAKEISGVVSSQQGASAAVRSRFQVGDCARLPVRPKMVLRVGARGKLTRGKRTPFTATLTQTPGQANLRSVEVTLPKTLNSRLDVVNRRAACSIEQFNADRCPMRVGTGTAVTPLLRDPLTGPAYFVYNPARRLPDLVVRLRGQVAIDLVGKVTITRDLRLQTTFDAVPDVAISKFRLALESGPRNGPIGVTRNLCAQESRATRATLAFVGQNGRRVDVTPKLQVAGCGAARRSATRRVAARRTTRRSSAKKR
ncbi:MAG TPA: hypothetical protein VLK58_21220 [Conexibacter sp.]|nr:hypothetical protein [Conexibacter sp.]